LEPPLFYTGIDQHRRSSVLTTYAEDGQVVGHATLPNEPLRLRRYFGQFPGSHRAVVEATGRWYWLRDLLLPDGIDLRLAHAKFLKAIAYAKVKTDAVDAGTLGQLLRTGFIPEAHMISEALRGPRDVLRTRLRLVQRCTSCQTSVDRLLEKFNVATVDQLPPLYQADGPSVSPPASELQRLPRTVSAHPDQGWGFRSSGHENLGGGIPDQLVGRVMAESTVAPPGVNVTSTCTRILSYILSVPSSLESPPIL
jgi:hypothetical protein